MVLTNVYGVALTIRATLPHLLERGDGHFLITSSVAGRRALPGSLYSATKWAATAIGEALRAELRQMHENHAIRVTLIEPGMVDTPFFDNRPGEWALRDDDIARAVIFALEQPRRRRRQRDPDPADASRSRPDQPLRKQQADQRASRRAGRAATGAERAIGGDEGRVEVGREPGGELGGADRAGRLDLAALAQQAGQPADHVDDRAPASASPSPPAIETGIRASSVAIRAGASRTSSARRVDADQEGPAVALEPAPLVLAGAELVVVVDDRGRLDPERAAGAAAAAARGRRPRGRGRSARGSRPPRSQVRARDRQAGAGERRHLAGRRRRRRSGGRGRRPRRSR